MIVLFDKLHFIRFKFTEIEYIIYQRQERFTGSSGILRVIYHRRIPAFAQNHFIHTNNGVDRRSDLVRHLREELRFSLARRNSSVNSLFELIVDGILPFKESINEQVNQNNAKYKEQEEEGTQGENVAVNAQAAIDDHNGEVRSIILLGKADGESIIVIIESRKIAFHVRIKIFSLFDIGHMGCRHLIVNVRVVDDVAVLINQEGVSVLIVTVTEDFDEAVKVEINGEDTEEFAPLAVDDLRESNAVETRLIVIVRRGDVETA